MAGFAFRFPAGRYHATPWGHHANEADVAWPPEPARILRAMIATWWRKLDHARYPKPLLDGLVDQLAAHLPRYLLPPAVHAHTPAFMPMRDNTEKRLIYDGFVALDAAEPLVISWQDVSLDENTAELARSLIGVLGYLGRSESWVEAELLPAWVGEPNSQPLATDGPLRISHETVDVTVPLTPREWEEARPTLSTTNRPLPVKLADALAIDTEVWRKAGWSSPPPIKQVVYTRPRLDAPKLTRPITARRQSGQPGRPEAARFVLAGRPLPRVEDGLLIAEAMRSALMHNDTKAPAVPPPELCGRDNDGPLRHDPAHSHAFFLPEDADGDGRIDHLLVYARLGFSPEARRRLGGLLRLWSPRLSGSKWRTALEAIAQPGEFADVCRLVGTATTWESSSPYLKPRFDRRTPQEFSSLIESYRGQIAREWASRGLTPPPARIEPILDGSRFAAPLGPGGASRSTLGFARSRFNRGGRQPDSAGGFFRLEFDSPIGGPIALGWGSHFGLGLFRTIR
ncbi:MAG TPA: type I-U CRISPR-associated protein Csb2 [Terriglobales bacterium]